MSKIIVNGREEQPTAKVRLGDKDPRPMYVVLAEAIAKKKNARRSK